MTNARHASHRRIIGAIAAAGSAALLAGCGLSNPNTASLGGAQTTHQASHHPTTPSPTTTTSVASGTQPPSNAGGPDAQAAIEQYAKLWCNWTTADLMAHERKLEAISVGGAHAQEEAALAAPTEGGTHITNTCKIESLAPGRGDAAGHWVLVTATTTTTETLHGLAPQFHVIYAGVTKRGARYLVNAWTPQS